MWEHLVRILKHGVPQGAVLGPMFFPIRLNDLVSCVTYCEVMILWRRYNVVENLFKYLYNRSFVVSIRKSKFMIMRNGDANMGE